MVMIIVERIAINAMFPATSGGMPLGQSAGGIISGFILKGVPLADRKVISVEEVLDIDIVPI